MSTKTCVHCGGSFEGVTTAKLCSLECAFWLKVNKSDGCWIWQGVTNEHGYGQINFRYYKNKAHRVSWIIHHGEEPGALDVLHKCDNPACVRPDHLFIGTAQDNVDDMRRKRRHLRGERCWKAALTEDDVRAIRASSERNCDLATRYGVARSAITLVRKRLTWQHVD